MWAWFGMGASLLELYTVACLHCKPHSSHLRLAHDWCNVAWLKWELDQEYKGKQSQTENNPNCLCISGHERLSGSPLLHCSLYAFTVTALQPSYSVYNSQADNKCTRMHLCTCWGPFCLCQCNVYAVHACMKC